MAHKIDALYQKLYLFGRQITKRDKFGIWLKIENICLDVLEFVIAASLEYKSEKILKLNSAWIKIEILKRLIRIAYDLKITEDKYYINLESDLREISKMTRGWINYLK